MKTVRAVARVLSQAVGAMAVLVFFATPFSSGAAWWLMGVSIIVGNNMLSRLYVVRARRRTAEQDFKLRYYGHFSS
jgi:hypothetical protein